MVSTSTGTSSSSTVAGSNGWYYLAYTNGSGKCSFVACPLNSQADPNNNLTCGCNNSEAGFDNVHNSC